MKKQIQKPKLTPKQRLISLGKFLWNILVLFAYAKFYIFCLVIGSIVITIATFIFAEYGVDVSTIQQLGPKLITAATVYCGIILLDKAIKMSSSR